MAAAGVDLEQLDFNDMNLDIFMMWTEPKVISESNFFQSAAKVYKVSSRP